MLITGSDEKSMDKASDLIEKMLRPIDDSKNEHKQKQLRELAIINGTLKSHDMPEATVMLQSKDELFEEIRYAFRIRW